MDEEWIPTKYSLSDRDVCCCYKACVQEIHYKVRGDVSSFVNSSKMGEFLCQNFPVLVK